jgi:hypothetical protein
MDSNKKNIKNSSDLKWVISKDILKKEYKFIEYNTFIEESLSKNKIEYDFGSNIIKIVLTPRNLNKISFEILYLYLKGFRKFVLFYNFKNIKLSQSKIFDFLKKDLYKLLNYKKDIFLFFEGFSYCVFENDFYTSYIKSNFNNIFYITEKNYDENIFFHFCNKCLFRNSCVGFNKDYISFAKSEITKPLIVNKNLKQKFLVENSQFKDEIFLKFYNFFLKDFLSDNYYRRKSLVFVDSFLGKKSESYEERFVYYINNFGDFDSNFLFLKNILSETSFNFFFDFFKKINLVVISFAKLNNGNYRFSIYFNPKNKRELVNDFFNSKIYAEKDLKKIFKVQSFEIEKYLWGYGLDYVFSKDEIFNESKKTIKKLDINIKNFNKKKYYFKFSKLSKKDLLYFLDDIPQKNKEIFNSFVKDFKQDYFKEVLLDFKVDNKNKLISKRVDLSGMMNKINFNFLNSILKEFKENKEISNVKFNKYKNKDIYTVSFEFYMKVNFQNKLNVYYTERY